jgi:hypothetical protein
MPMRPTTSSLARIAALAALALLAADAADAATKKAKAKMQELYRCTDAKGQTHFAQNIPAECMDRDVEVVDKTGQVLRVIPGRGTLEEQARAQAEAETNKKAAEQAAQRDRTLLATYLTVADIERLRDQRLEILQQQAQVTQQYIANLRGREERLMDDVQKYRPYNDKPNAPVLPDHIGEDIVNTVNGLQVYEQELAKNTTEQTRLRDEFASDISRFKELKGIK